MSNVKNIIALTQEAVANSSTGDVNFDNNTLYIDKSTDRVGVGTTTPTTSLDVSGTLKGTTVTSSGDVNDSEGDVRTPRHFSKNTDTTLENEGVYIFRPGASTITLGSPPAGTVMAVYNNTGSGLTLEDGATVTSMRLSDGVGSHNNSLTIANRTLATITMIAQNACVVTGSDVS